MDDGAQVANPNHTATPVWTHSTISRLDGGTRGHGTEQNLEKKKGFPPLWECTSQETWPQVNGEW